MSNGTPTDPDDFFSDTRMSFGDHLEELRAYLWRAIYGFGIALFFSLFIGHIILGIITAPVKSQLERYYDRRQKRILAQQQTNAEFQEANRPSPFRAVLVPRKQFAALAKGEDPTMPRPRIVTEKQIQEEKNPVPPSFLSQASKWFNTVTLEYDEAAEVGEKETGETTPIPEADKDKELVRLWVSTESPLKNAADLQRATRKFLDIGNPTSLNVQEAFMVWFKVCMATGIVIGSPWIFWQIWMFVAAGLYPHEKRLVHVYLPVSLFLFLAGVVICELFVIPRAVETLLWFNELMDIKPDFRLTEWLSFAIWMPIIFGASFQTPLVMLFLNRLGIMDVEAFRGRRKIAWFAMAVFAAMITPSTDALSMLFLWVPMSLLFELGIILIQFSPKNELGDDAPEPDEMVEV
jgi:sec-independent protein translocase protein TatC